MISGNRTLISDSGEENVDTNKAITLLRTRSMLRSYLRKDSTLRCGLGPCKIGMCGNAVRRNITSGSVNTSMGTRENPSCNRDSTFIGK